MNSSYADLSSARTYSVGTLPFISDTSRDHSRGCGAFEHLLFDDKRGREEPLAGLQWGGGVMAGGEGEQICAPSVAKLPPLFMER